MDRLIIPLTAYYPVQEGQREQLLAEGIRCTPRPWSDYVIESVWPICVESPVLMMRDKMGERYSKKTEFVQITLPVGTRFRLSETMMSVFDNIKPDWISRQPIYFDPSKGMDENIFTEN